MSAESQGFLTHHGKKPHYEAVSLKAKLESLRVAHTRAFLVNRNSQWTHT